MRGRTVTIQAQNAHMANVMNAVVLSCATTPATAITAGRASVAAAATMNTRWRTPGAGRGRKRQQGDYPEQHILLFLCNVWGAGRLCTSPCPAGRRLSGSGKDSESRGDSKIYFSTSRGILFAGKIAGSVCKPCPSPIFRDAPSPPRRSRESGAGGRNQIPCRFFWHISC